VHADVEREKNEVKTIAITCHYYHRCYHCHRHVVSDRSFSLAQSKLHENQLLPFGEYIATCTSARHFGELLHQIWPSTLLLRLLLLLRCIRLRLGLCCWQHCWYSSHGLAGTLRTTDLHTETARLVLLRERLVQLLL